MRSRLSAAFAAAPRTDFLPEDQKQFADLDIPLPIGFSVTNSQPTTVRNMLELLSVNEGNRVLDLGSGSGWTSALLSHLVGSSGEVVAVERIPELVERSRAALSQRQNITVEAAQPGVLGCPEKAPYDRILVSAMADRLPRQLFDQMAVGGVLVIPVQGTMIRAVRTDGFGPMEISEHGPYSFVPLVETDRSPESINEETKE